MQDQQLDDGVALYSVYLLSSQACCAVSLAIRLVTDVECIESSAGHTVLLAV